MPKITTEITHKITYFCKMLRHFFKNKMRFFALLAPALLLSACTKEFVSPIPNIDRFSFDVFVRVDTMIMDAIVHPHVGFNGNGIIIYHHHSGVVRAFDVTCPDSEVCVERGVVAHDGAGNPHATCRRCSSRYYLLDGRHTAQRVMLRPYRIERLGRESFFFRVSNF